MQSLNEKKGDLPMEAVHEGITFPWMVSDRVLATLKDYDIHDDDVWVTTYPKAGTHWAVEISTLILADGNMDQIDRKKQPSPIEFDFSQRGPTRPQGVSDEVIKPPFESCKEWPSPRILMTHLPEQFMPKQILQGKGKVIFVIRNPKDIAVSMWHFMQPLKNIYVHQDWDTFFDIYCTDKCHYGTWFSYNLAFWKKHRGDKNFLFLKYEDMKQDTRGAVVQVADFLGRHLSDEAIDRITNAVSVNSMKARFKTAGGADTSGKPKIGAPGILRKGVVGDWKTQFTVAQNDRFDKLFRERMEGSDLHIDFD